MLSATSVIPTHMAPSSGQQNRVLGAGCRVQGMPSLTAYKKKANKRVFCSLESFISIFSLMLINGEKNICKYRKFPNSLSREPSLFLPAAIP